MSMELNDKVEQAKRLIKSVASMHNVTIAYSGGKDSQVLAWLVKEAGVKCDLVYNNTTIDPPGTIEWCRKNGARVQRNELSFLDLVEKKGYPTMFRRHCCKELKEKYISPYLFIGVRADESVKRSKCYSDFESVYYFSKEVYTNRFLPLLKFSTEDVGRLIVDKSIECHPLYYDHEGKFDVRRRLGCIGCPLQSDRGKIDFLRYPILLKQILRRGILFHQRMGRTDYDAALNLVYNIFYSNHGHKRFSQTYKGLFDTDPYEILGEYFFIDRDEVLRLLPNPKFAPSCCKKRRKASTIVKVKEFKESV